MEECIPEEAELYRSQSKLSGIIKILRDQRKYGIHETRIDSFRIRAVMKKGLMDLRNKNTTVGQGGYMD